MALGNVDYFIEEAFGVKSGPSGPPTPQRGDFGVLRLKIPIIFLLQELGLGNVPMYAERVFELVSVITVLFGSDDGENFGKGDLPNSLQGILYLALLELE